MLVWVVADATVDGSETGTSFRQALGFMERGLKLHDTMIYSVTPSRFIKGEPRYVNSFEYMFVFVKGRYNTANLIKDVPTLNNGQSYIRMPSFRKQDGEPADTNSNYGKRAVVQPFTKRSNIWHYSSGNALSKSDNASRHHPAQFPIALAKDHIRTWTNPGDVVLDPMAGSGTTLRAAKDLGRTAIGVEIHADYLSIITGRMAQGVLV